MVALARIDPRSRGALRPRSDRFREQFTGKITRRKRVTDDQRARIVALYEDGLSSTIVAERVDVSKTTVLSILKDAGVTRRPCHVKYLTD